MGSTQMDFRLVFSHLDPIHTLKWSLPGMEVLNGDEIMRICCQIDHDFAQLGSINYLTCPFSPYKRLHIQKSDYEIFKFSILHSYQLREH